MQEIVKAINNKLIPSQWYSTLRIFLESSDFADIITELKRKVDEDKQRFCPALNKAFRFLEECPYDKITTVMLIDYSCNILQQADGIPLSTVEKYIDHTPVPLFQSIDNNQHKSDPNLWAKQGVLIVPLSLTSRIEGRSHKKIWSPLIMRIIESVNKKYPKIPWLLIGQDTYKYQEDIVSPHIRLLELKNPMLDTTWSDWSNEVLKSQGRSSIMW